MNTTTATAPPDDPGGATLKEIAYREKFDAAYSEWLAARADIYAAREDDGDEAADKRFARERAAELALVSMPAPSGYGGAVQQKFELLESMVATDYEAGEPAYPLVVLAVASIKADLLAFGFKNMGRE
jgi:hypothetical protein